MRRVLFFTLLCLALVSTAAQAIQLHWSSGAVNLTFTEATRCTLVVQADSAEVTLPAEWQLLWVADSTQVEVVALDSIEVCAADTAQVYDVEGPATSEDSTANRWTAQFCSGGSSVAAGATYVLDLPAWARGKLKVVALDPADSTSVIESNEVLFNGGVSDDFQTTVLDVESTHEGTDLVISAVGTGLDAAESAKLVAPDGSWTVKLDLVSRSSSTLTASAYVAVDLPASVLAVESASGVSAVASVPADFPYAPMSQIGSSGLMVPGDSIQPKDFAFLYQARLGIFHLFYIWQDRKIVAREGGKHDSTEKFLGHAWSKDLLNWTQMPTVLAVRDTSWDNFHVWAPHIIQKDLTYYMFYTGVTLDPTDAYCSTCEIQRIGVATASATTPDDSLKTWERMDDWIFSHNNVEWAVHDTSVTKGQQFRDPFVMLDSDSTGPSYLMYCVTRPQYDTLSYVVGVARSDGDLTRWRNYGAMHNTDSSAVPYDVIESPHLFSYNDRSLNRLVWRLLFTAKVSEEVVDVHQEKSTTRTASDTLATGWGPQVALFDYLDGDSTVSAWMGSEYLWAMGHEYLAAYDDHMWAIDINEVNWRVTSPYDFYLTMPSVADVGGSSYSDAGDGGVGLSLAGLAFGGSEVRLRMDVPRAMRVRLDLFDVLGRRLRTLLDKEVAAGRTTVAWDGRDGNGRALGSGIYFARLMFPGGRRTVRVPLAR
jgi:hypothetical protein